MSNNVNPAVEESIAPSYRTLFVGLGGTGGEVLYNLWERMSLEERAHAHVVYIDTDQDDIKRLRHKGIPAVNLGSSDSVLDILNYLGYEDGVWDWFPYNPNETTFLNSSTHDGASQCRAKSRLCLAKFLKNTDNDLARMLASVSVPGSELNQEPLRVMIVSSIAGGTGAGTFIQVALYLREYFRKHGHSDISITGMFACPDLYVESQAVSDPDQIESMYANAYAAVRELNAMNLVVDGGARRTSDGYGRSIHMKMDTVSETKLFDSEDADFASNSNNKPYNLIYLMDVANTSGGVLRSIDQYYRVMADVAYTRLYTALEGPLRSGESNEMKKHQDYPTAIYGSAGYGRIVYPYEGVIDYLALKKTFDEMDYTWTILENEWDKYQSNEKAKERAAGRRWTPTTYDRGNRYISDLTVALGKENTRLMELAPMIRSENVNEDRADAFLALLESELYSVSGLEGGDEQADGTYGLWTDEKVAAARESICDYYNNFMANKPTYQDAASIIVALKEFASNMESAVQSYTHAMRTCATGCAYYVSSLVAPRNERDGEVAMREKDPLNLFHGLLSLNGQAVHPVAARYLLYSLRKKMKERLDGLSPDILRADLDRCGKDLVWVLDTNREDNDFINVETRMSQISKSFFLFRTGAASAEMEKYVSALTSVVDTARDKGNDLLVYEVYTRILEVVEVLIEKYEGLFDNLNQYRTDLSLKLARERDRHELASDDRCIFINGSRQAKEYLYYADRRTRDVLDASSDEISAAAGEGVYHALMERTWEHIEHMEDVQLSNGYLEMEEDTFSDLGDVFDGIVSIYKKYLKKKATHLHVNVVAALIRECCRAVGVEERELGDNAEKRAQVRSAFEAVIRNMLSKSEPMLNFNVDNSDPYFAAEITDEMVRTAVLYTQIGMSPEARDALRVLYPGTEVKDAQAAFETVFKPHRGTTVHEDISDYEMIAFKAVHCLQPTQVRKLREDYTRGFYYHYKKRLKKMTATESWSNTPHLDKRWHLREAMPYISRTMDVAWHHKTARAFVYEILNHTLKFTTDMEGVTCFTYPQNGQDVETCLYWPGKRLITVSDISRLLEYLQENDELVELKNQQLDELIDSIMERMSKYTSSMPVYKGMLTSHPTLRDLRCNLLVYGSIVHTGHRARQQDVDGPAMSEQEAEKLKALSIELGIEESELADAKKTLGGLVEIAWLVHQSEENQGRDHDFGECIIQCARDIIEMLARKMCGVNVGPDSPQYEDYCDLYNSIVEKFMESYVLRIMREQGVTEVKNAEVFYRYLKVPENVSNTSKYKWAAKVLPLKDPKDRT